MDAIYDFILTLGDRCFDWLLLLPSDATIIAVALITSLILLVARLFTVNQDLGRRCSADKKVLKKLIKAAKSVRDKDAVSRYQATVGRIGIKRMKMEVKPALAALLPIAFLAVWAFERLGFFPPKVNEPIVVSFHYPVSASGRLVHLAPDPGFTPANSWLRRLENEKGDPDASMASWKLRFAEASTHKLKFRFDDKTYEHEVAVGGRHYGHTIKVYPENNKIASVVHLPQRKLFGVVPGYEALGCAPWMIGYLLVTIPLVFINKALFRIE